MIHAVGGFTIWLIYTNHDFCISNIRTAVPFRSEGDALVIVKCFYVKSDILFYTTVSFNQKVISISTVTLGFVSYRFGQYRHDTFAVKFF